MRRSWPANLIAAIVITTTLGVGVLGALGSPKATSEAGRTSRGMVTPTESSVPSCAGRFTSGHLSFDCPSGWFIWQSSTFDDDPSTQVEVIISNHRPLERGGEGLPDGWFKVDMYVAPRDPNLTFERLAKEPCTSTDGTQVESCGVVTIAGRRWMQRIERDPLTEYRSIGTVVDGIEIHVIAIVPDGALSAAGGRAIDALLASLSIR